MTCTQLAGHIESLLNVTDSKKGYKIILSLGEYKGDFFEVLRVSILLSDKYLQSLF